MSVTERADSDMDLLDMQDPVDMDDIAEIDVEAVDTADDLQVSPVLNRIMDATQLYLGEIGFSPYSLLKKKSILPVGLYAVMKPPVTG